MSRAVDISVSEHLRKMPPAVRSTVEAARRTVLVIAPEAHEIPYQSHPPRSASAMWKIARYAIDGTNVLGIGTFPTHSTIFFYRGRELDDGSGLLQGGGKDSRLVTLRTSADVERSAVKEVVRKALKLGPPRRFDSPVDTRPSFQDVHRER